MMNDVAAECPDTILTLPNGTSASDIASTCREAGLQFINHLKHWGKAELAMWLAASYAPVTKHATKETSSSTVWPAPLLGEIDVRLIDRIVQSARSEIASTTYSHTRRQCVVSVIPEK